MIEGDPLPRTLTHSMLYTKCRYAFVFLVRRFQLWHKRCAILTLTHKKCHINLNFLLLSRSLALLWHTYDICNAMVTNHLRRPYGARPAAGRIVRFFIIFLDIVRCPVKFRYYLKFHGARTAFGRVIEGKITSAGHRTVPGRRPSGVFTHRTAPDDFYLIFISYDSNGARPGTVRCPAGHRTMTDKRQKISKIA